jgi:hypothetical protein
MAITKIYKGINELENVVKIYKGSELLWDKPSGEPTNTTIQFNLPSELTFSLSISKGDALDVIIRYDDSTTETLTGTGSKTTAPKTYSMGEHTIIIEGEGKFSFSGSILGSARNVYLTEIILGTNLLNINNYFLNGNTNIANVIIPSSVVGISQTAFSGDNSNSYVETINVHEDNQYFCSIDGCLYSKDLTRFLKLPPKSTLEIISLEKEVIEISSQAFYGNTNINTVVLPTGLTTIGYRAFYNCSNLETINFPISISSLGNQCLNGTMWFNNHANGVAYVNQFLYGYSGTAPSSTTINVVNGTTVICQNAFSGQTGIIAINLPNTLQEIRDNAFYNCSGLTSLIVPNSVTSIGYSALYGCGNLANLTIPFVGSSVSNVTASRNSLFSHIFGWSTSPYAGSVLKYQRYSASSSVSTYLPSALNTVIVSGGNLLYGAFYSCSMITSLTLPNNITSIGNQAIAYCSGINSITIPSSVTNIETQAFNFCSNLQNVTVYAETPPVIGTSIFNGTHSNLKIYVPSGSVDAYKLATNWSTYASRIFAIGS